MSENPDHGATTTPRRPRVVEIDVSALTGAPRRPPVELPPLCKVRDVMVSAAFLLCGVGIGMWW